MDPTELALWRAIVAGRYVDEAPWGGLSDWFRERGQEGKGRALVTIKDCGYRPKLEVYEHRSRHLWAKFVAGNSAVRRSLMGSRVGQLLCTAHPAGSVTVIVRCDCGSGDITRPASKFQRGYWRDCGQCSGRPFSPYVLPDGFFDALEWPRFLGPEQDDERSYFEPAAAMADLCRSISETKGEGE
jgi:hypothetical protein